MTLSNYTDEQLQVELKERKEKTTIPILLANPDISKVQEACQRRITFLLNRYGYNADIRNQVYEEAMIACYGVDIFKWINEHLSLSLSLSLSSFHSDHTG